MCAWEDSTMMARLHDQPVCRSNSSGLRPGRRQAATADRTGTTRCSSRRMPRSAQRSRPGPSRAGQRTATFAAYERTGRASAATSAILRDLTLKHPRASRLLAPRDARFAPGRLRSRRRSLRSAPVSICSEYSRLGFAPRATYKARAASESRRLQRRHRCGRGMPSVIGVNTQSGPRSNQIRSIIGASPSRVTGRAAARSTATTSNTMPSSKLASVLQAPPGSTVFVPAQPARGDSMTDSVSQDPPTLYSDHDRRPAAICARRLTRRRRTLAAVRTSNNRECGPMGIDDDRRPRASIHPS